MANQAKSVYAALPFPKRKVSSMPTDDDRPLANYIAIVLAGGEGRRMGCNKLLLDISARPMIRHVVETIRGVIADVIVVTGHQRERIEEALVRTPVEFVASPPSDGAATAIRRAFERARLLAAQRRYDGIMLCVGDQPRLTEREIAGLIKQYSAGDRRKALVPVRGERRGYPVMIPPDFDVEGVDLLSESLIADYPDQIAAFPTRNPVYDSSLDTPEDFRSFFAISERL
ncbi:nucleotidyltransferase family protein [Labrys neptuniae]|uniref:NTP transferase domain-containing protein n=1 Tax=Labrys neptuniae TaxID=376174 RepID=A0ABV3PLD5_9HYPH